MAGLTKRNGMWYATWKQNGTTIKRATGFPVGSTREEQRKNKLAAEQTANSMEATAKGQPIDKALDAMRAVGELVGSATRIPSLRVFLVSA